MRTRFVSVCNGDKLEGQFASVQQTIEVCEALNIVESATIAGSCIQCDANPFQLLCYCKGCRKIGVCSHLLLITHVIAAGGAEEDKKAHLNLKWMNSQISARKDKSSKKKNKGGRPKLIRHCLQREDSDGDDTGPPPLALCW
jgi:hypothetical protein